MNNSCSLDDYTALANRVLDIGSDDFEMRSPIYGLDKQPLLSFKAITEAGAFVLKLLSAAMFAQIASKGARQKLHKLGSEAYGLTADEIAMIYLCVLYTYLLSNYISKTLCVQLHNGEPVLSRFEQIASRSKP